MKNSIKNNKKIWDEHYAWENDGDEWDGQARYCNVTYDRWKNSLVETLILPNIPKSGNILEIAPGHGRWSKFLATSQCSLVLVDLSPSCIEFCRNIFTANTNISYIINDGQTLEAVADNSIDFIWSYDSFVHMEKGVISCYMGEMFRVLKPGGKAIIHHPGRNPFFLWLGFTRYWGALGMYFYKIISMNQWSDNDGWRSNVSKKTMVNLAKKHRLTPVSQFQFWDNTNQIGVPRYNDGITILQKI
jgi:ubiquinone/menaquinone biosynthesis C-methylase UbiE